MNKTIRTPVKTVKGLLGDVWMIYRRTQPDGTEDFTYRRKGTRTEHDGFESAIQAEIWLECHINEYYIERSKK